MADALSLRELNRATLARQMLLGREAVSAVDAVGRLAGMQAQEPRPPFVGLWTRVEGFDREELDVAIASHDVVRATLMRATLHLLPASEYWLYRTALEPALDAAFQGVAGKFAEGLDLDKVLAVARKELAGEPRNFKELTAALVAAFPGVDERAPRYFTRTGLPLLMVPSAEDRWGFPRTPRFELAEKRLGKGKQVRGAGGELVRRYLAAFGPASVADFATWSGIRKPAPLFEELSDELVVFAGDKSRELFDLPDAPRPGADVAAPVRFLPDFDNLVLGHADRRRIVAEEHRPLLTPGKNLRVKATFLVDGFVAGTWKAERKGKKATLALEPFGKLTKKATKELRTEGEELLRLLEPDAIAEFHPL